MTAWIVSGLVLVGALFVAVAGVGLLRMPDLFTRLHAAAKAPTLGIGCLLLAFGVHFGGVDTWVRAFLLIAFLYLTGPVAAHLLGRVAYRIGVPLSRHIRLDELEARYDRETDSVYSGRQAEGTSGVGPGSDDPNE